MTDISTPSQLTSCELTLESLKPSSNSISPISTPTMASSSLPFILEVSKSQRNNSASSSNSDNVGDAQVQQFPATETPCLDIKNNHNSLDHIQSFSSLNSHQQSSKQYFSGYLQHLVSMTPEHVMTWKRTYFCLYENQLMCYKTQDTAIPLFEVHFTINSVLAHHEAETDSSLSLEKHNLMSLHRTLSSFGSLVFLLQFVEIIGHQIPAKAIEVPILLKTENEADYVAWTECLTHVIQARKRALLQVNGEKSRRDDVTLLAQSQLSGSATSIDLPKRRSLDTNGQEIAKMLRRTSGASAVPDIPVESNNLAEVETYEAFSSKYLLMKEIGEGSFSIVHRAVNRMTGQVCAVKCCKVSQALEEEERLLRTLSHPNVVSLEGVFQRDKNLHFVVMDYLKDGDLCDQLIERQRLPEPEARRIIRQVVEGLAYLHRRCVLHRDIKPENILIHGNMVKIADFGLAKELEQPTTLLKRSCGTLEYAAPELLCGQPYGLKSDVFSLGIVLYVLLFGAFPFSVESAAALQCMDHFPTSVDVRDMSCLSSSNVQWRIVSPLAQDVLLKMLKTSDTERISAENLLNHPWFNEADAGMSESIITPKDLELSHIEDCEAMGFAELLSRGFRVVKYSDKESMTPYVTSLSINFMEECINWTARKNPLRTSEVATVCRTGQDRAISLRDIKEIREGHTTKAFQSHKNMKPIPPPELCLSIICPWKTLDLVIEAPSQRRFMVRGLRRLITSDA